MPLDIELQPIVDMINSLDAPPPQEQSVDEVRSAYAAMSVMFGTGDGSITTADAVVPGPAGDLPVRWYRPADATTSDAAVVVYLHGGGWVIGSVDTHDPVCRELAARTGTAVVAVDYRLAPESPYPAAVDDCVAAVEWISDHAGELGIDASRIVVAGDSAGGQLATTVARRWSSDRPPLALQVLIYPVTDLSALPPQSGASGTSLVENGTGYVLTLETMEYFADNYTPSIASRAEPDASPLLAEDLVGLPPALVLTAEFDPLRDEGEAYADRLADAGVPVVANRYDGATHMFVQMLGLGIAERALDEVAAAVRGAVGAAAD